MAMTSPLKDRAGLYPGIGGNDHPIALVLDSGIHRIVVNPKSLAFDALLHRPNQFALIRRKIIGDNGSLRGQDELAGTAHVLPASLFDAAMALRISASI